jgi:hypothetical protein
VLGTVQFNFPIRRSDYRFAHEFAGSPIVRTLVTTHGTCFVRTSVDVDRVRRWADYTADPGSCVECSLWGRPASVENGSIRLTVQYLFALP